MKVFNIFCDIDNSVVASVVEEHFAAYVEWQKGVLKKEMDDHVALLRVNHFEVSAPEWMHDLDKFGFTCTSKHPTFELPIIEKRCLWYREADLWTPDQTT